MDAYSLELLGRAVGGAVAIGGAGLTVMKFVVPRVRRGAALFAELAAMPDLVKTIAHEVRPNGGSSMRDKVDRIASDVRGMKALQRARGNSSTDGEFESDADGRCLHSNMTYLRWTERSEAEVSGWGWLSCIAEHDRDNVREEWIDCVREQREFRMRYAMVSASGNEFSVDTVALPVRDGDTVLGWHGHVRKRHPTGAQSAMPRMQPDEE